MTRGSGKSKTYALSRDNIGQALLAECKRRGLTQAEASERFGVTKQTFNEWVNRKRDVPAAHATKLARFLRVPVAEVRELIDTPRQDRLTVLEQEHEKLSDAFDELKRNVEAMLNAVRDAIPQLNNASRSERRSNAS